MDLIDREKALGCFWNYANDDGTGYDETDMPAYDRLQALPIVAEVEDCISRQDAIDGADEIIKRDTSGNNAVVEAMKAWKVYIGKLPSAQPETSRIENALHGKSAEEQYDFIWWLIGIYGMQFTDSRRAAIEWLRGEQNESD